MDKQVIFESPAATLWYHPDDRIVHHEVHKFIYGAALRELLTKGGEVLKKNHARKWLSDDRKNGALSKDDGEWAAKVWQPPMVAAGWNTWAMVQPEAVIGQLNIRKFTENFLAMGLNVKVFSDPAPALTWLRSV